ncbi:MAG: molybdopterin-dependent oxidoreductase, partial [Candidatus Anammoxibacter sp.]
MKTVYNACPRDCYDTCSIVTTVEDGRITKVSGNKEHPVTQGFLCAKVGRYATDIVYSRERIQYPMKRVGKKGEARFERISWDEAYDIICEKIRDVQATQGYEKILQYGYFGHMGLLNRHFSQRFFNAINCSNISPTICSLAGRTALKYVYGNFTGMDPEQMLDSKLVIFWGLNSMWSNVHGYTLAKKAAKKGAKFWIIDPVKTETAQIGKHLSIQPGTDGVLAMGIANYLISNNLYDKDFVEKNTFGFDKFKETVKIYDIDYVSEITGLQKDDILELAKDISSLRPNFIHLGFGLQKQINGGEIVRTIALLPALVGQHRIHYSNSDRDLALPYLQGKHLATKPQKLFNMTQLGKIVDNCEISMLFVYGSNPLNTCPNQGLLKKGFERDDFFLVVHDLFLNDTACFADIVLPSTSLFETFDVNVCYYHNYMTFNNKAIENVGESKSNYEAFIGLAKRFGLKGEWLDE